LSFREATLFGRYPPTAKALLCAASSRAACRSSKFFFRRGLPLSCPCLCKRPLLCVRPDNKMRKENEKSWAAPLLIKALFTVRVVYGLRNCSRFKSPSCRARPCGQGKREQGKGGQVSQRVPKRRHGAVVPAVPKVVFS
jgi:hypothetical protein